jgi:hypothetical protein
MNHPGSTAAPARRGPRSGLVSTRCDVCPTGQLAGRTRLGRKINDGNNERNTLSGSYILQPSISNISLTIGADPTRRKPNGEYGAPSEVHSGTGWISPGRMPLP